MRCSTRWSATSIGLQADGSLDPSYARVVGSPCVDINSGANRNRVGMPGNANRNVISGCYEKAVTFYNEFTWQNYVQNNILGLDPTGTKRRQNDYRRRHQLDRQRQHRRRYSASRNAT